MPITLMTAGPHDVIMMKLKNQQPKMRLDARRFASHSHRASSHASTGSACRMDFQDGFAVVFDRDFCSVLQLRSAKPRIWGAGGWESRVVCFVVHLVLLWCPIIESGE